jgi:glycosyltransferase involved in cell wall biosynthesis
MKILVMARWFFPHVGGASVRVYNIAKNLRKSGHEIHLLTHHPKSIPHCTLKGDVPFSEKYEGINVYRLPYFGPKPAYWAMSVPMMAKRAEEIIEREKIDVILSHNPPYLIGLSSWLASKGTGVPFVILAHDVWGASHYSKAQQAVGANLEKFCVRKASKVIVPCKGLDDILMKRTGLGRSRFVVAPTGVDEKMFKPGRKKTKAKTVMFVGNLAPWSGCRYLVEAAPAIVEEVPGVKIMVVGHGIEHDALAARTKKLGLENTIKFIGAVPPEKLPTMLNEADVCVAPFPSPETVGRDTSLLPISVLEFMSAGKAIVISDVPGIRDFVKDGKTGLLFEAENTKELASKVVEVLKNNKMRGTLGKNARNYILKGQTWEKTAKIVERTLKEVVR